MNTPSIKRCPKHQRQVGSIGIHCVQGATCFGTWKSVTPLPHFQVSQYIPMDPDTEARCGYTLSFLVKCFEK